MGPAAYLSSLHTGGLAGRPWIPPYLGAVFNGYHAGHYALSLQSRLLLGLLAGAPCKCLCRWLPGTLNSSMQTNTIALLRRGFLHLLHGPLNTHGLLMQPVELAPYSLCRFRILLAYCIFLLFALPHIAMPACHWSSARAGRLSACQCGVVPCFYSCYHANDGWNGAVTARSRPRCHCHWP